MIERSRCWVVNGICQVCLGDAFQHVISGEDVYWCNAAELVELGKQYLGE